MARIPDPERQPRGFAGLSSMVSDVDETIRKAERGPASSERTSPGKQGAAQWRAKSAEAGATGSHNGGRKKGLSGWKILLGAVGLIYLFMVIDANSTDSGSTRRPASETRAASQPAAVNSPIGSPAGRPTEERPPVGRGRTLNVAQIRYCEAQGIRLEGADPLVNTYSQREVDTFNAWVDDFNSRCSDFRYYEGTLSRARRDIQPLRTSLLAEGRSAFLRSVGRSAPAMANERVRKIQTLLNARGYSAGPADGVMGPSTREAIRQFQRDRGMTPDGEASEAVLYVLQYRSTGR